MKILIVHNKYLERGGEDTVVENELDLLRRNREDCEVVFFNNSGSSLTRFFKFLFYPFNIFSYLKMRKIINDVKPDVIHVHNFFYEASPSIFYAIKHKNKPFVVTIHNFRLLCPSGILFSKGKLYLKSLGYQYSFQPALDKVYRNSVFLTFWLYTTNYFHAKLGTWNLPDKYIFVSKFSQDIFLESNFLKYKDKFELKYNFMSPKNEIGHYKNVHNSYVYVGRLSEEKGINLLLDVFSKSTFNLLIIGNGKLKDEVVKNASINNNIKYLGFKSNDEILKILSESKALIFPSIWYEGMPLTIIEALSAGTPIIASDIGAMSEMVVDNVNGFHFKPGDADDMSEKIKSFDDLDKERYKELRISTLKDFHDRFTDSKSFVTLKDIYKKIL